MSSWYRRFVPTFSARTAIRTDLTKRTCLSKVQWKKEAETSFKDVNEALSKQLVLYSPDFDNTFTMQTDASECGAGADIQGEPGDCHPIAYISCSREALFSTVEKKCLAVKLALDSFSFHLLGVLSGDGPPGSAVDGQDEGLECSHHPLVPFRAALQIHNQPSPRARTMPRLISFPRWPDSWRGSV